MPTIKINLNINDRVLDEIDTITEQQGRNRSDFIREAIAKLIQDYKKAE